MTYWCPRCEKFIAKSECYADYNTLSQEYSVKHNSPCNNIVEELSQEARKSCLDSINKIERLNFKQSTQNQTLIISVLLLSSIFDALRDCTISYPIGWWTWHTVKIISMFSVWTYLWFQLKNEILWKTWAIRTLVALSSYFLWEAAYKFGPEILK